MVTQATMNMSISYLKTQIDKIQSSENLNYLWEIALELNNNKALTNTKLQAISKNLYDLKRRMNKNKLNAVKQILIYTIQKV
jgi:hypothetical protein